ncbi:MAG: hypothetical protein CMO30_13540 [Tistrella sp.]|uniref:DUF4065 domain-containing protein n=1 Tax=Tistrella mobilis TaxID=171437 RepID=A0A3B9IS00_9PROT|nr:hypothetical protein [Tistrella sp.]MAD39274.1 hypothetical protein [Tistrella sp.]MBA76290.1 hypothetical protein [Tistrella sp.]HAE49989.1 hypothetical protein [Tistrella mobilis]
MQNSEALKVAGIVRDAGGRIVGRTRLQKTAYLLTLAGLEDGLSFSYKHYGPYSEAVAEGARVAGLFNLVTESEGKASWGGFYSTYELAPAGEEALPSTDPATEASRRALAVIAADANAVVLELAATAAYLAAEENHATPWAETARRKPEKAGEGRIDEARRLYDRLRKVSTPRPLPEIVD